MAGFSTSRSLVGAGIWRHLKLTCAAWEKMAAGKEQQQAHRPGIYKQENKQHKHGKHRTKGEIGRENKGNSGRFIFLIVFLSAIFKAMAV